jgi:hypothetical protein
VIDGRDRRREVPFLLDLDLQARLLLALPLLIGGEVVVHRRMPVAVRQFVERRIVVGAARAGFDTAASSALAFSRSVIAEILILVCVYTIGVEVGTSITSLSDSTYSPVFKRFDGHHTGRMVETSRSVVRCFSLFSALVLPVLRVEQISVAGIACNCI